MCITLLAVLGIYFIHRQKYKQNKKKNFFVCINVWLHKKKIVIVKTGRNSFVVYYRVVVCILCVASREIIRVVQNSNKPVPCFLFFLKVTQHMPFRIFFYKRKGTQQSKIILLRFGKNKTFLQDYFCKHFHGKKKETGSLTIEFLFVCECGLKRTQTFIKK